jgi:hypothetical protein
MTRTTLALAVILFCFCTSVRAEEAATSKTVVVKQKAVEVGQAFLKGDYAKVADLTYPKIVEALGGREKMITATEAAVKRLRAQGITFKSYAVKEPSEFLTEGTNTFTVVPTVIEMTIPGGRSISRSFLLGVSPDSGKTWTFADGTGLQSQPDREKLLPKLPAALKLPAEQEPEVIKDKP